MDSLLHDGIKVLSTECFHFQLLPLSILRYKPSTVEGGQRFPYLAENKTEPTGHGVKGTDTLQGPAICPKRMLSLESCGGNNVCYSYSRSLALSGRKAA